MMERAVFKYELEGKPRFADPSVVRRRLTKAFGAGNLKDIADQAEDKSQPELQIQAQERLEDGIREAFDLPAFDMDTGDGPTFIDCLNLWNAWFAFVDDEKKKLGTQPTCSVPTESTAAIPAPISGYYSTWSESGIGGLSP